MKYFLLIEQNTMPSGNDRPLFLTDEEKETLPFSLIHAPATNAKTEVPTLPDETETEMPAETTDETTDEAPIEPSPKPESIPAAPTALILSDDAEILTKATGLGFATFRLPKRRFPLTDTLVSLSLNSYETVAVISTQPIEEACFPLFSDRRCLAVNLSDKTAPTYRANFGITAKEVTLSALLDAWTAPTHEDINGEPQIEKKPPFLHSLFEWIELFVLSLAAVLLIMTFFIRHSPVIGSSMSPTLHEGDVLLLTQIGFTPETGDIVIIQTDKDDLRRPLVKRVIATGGQTVRIDFVNWQIYLDGILLKEDYLNSTNKSSVMELYSIARYFTPVEGETDVYEATVPDGHLFVLGDNRQNSKDSRDLGFIDERHVIGEVIYRLLPLSAIGDPS